MCDGQPGWTDLTTLDYNADHKPDIVWDLMRPELPFDADTFDEIHAYQVLEHLGQQGDWKRFFAQFSDYWRVLKPGGHLLATCPSRHSAWAWGDPSHSRIIQPESLVFLNQPAYTEQVGKTPMSDFRFVYKADFDIAHAVDDLDTFHFIIKAHKPSRITE
jgi:SAM-dependent methyltransferase